MGAPTIETQLRNRILAAVVPTVLAVALASIAMTNWLLSASDRESALARASSALHLLQTESAEGDPVDVALKEAIESVSSEGVRVAVKAAGQDWRSGSIPMFDAARSLEPGACASFDDEQSVPWVACSASEHSGEAIVAIRVQGHRAAVHTLARATLGLAGALVAALIWAVRRAVRGPVLSIRNLADWSEQVNGDEASEPPIATTVEVQKLARSFDRLVHRLLESLARERATSAHIAHELRTPLTAMAAELDQCKGGGNEEAILRIRADMERLAQVIEAILVLSRPASSPSHRGVVNLADLAREAAGAATVVEAPDEALIHGDERLIWLALSNLLDNALKYSGRPATMIRVSNVAGVAKVAVLDDGPGLDEEAREKVFDRYWRGTSESGGSGLGLALVRAVAERHGGRAEAHPGRESGLEVSMSLGPIVGWFDDKPGES